MPVECMFDLSRSMVRIKILLSTVQYIQYNTVGPTYMPLCVVLRISNGVRENKPVSHNWKKGCGRLDLNQLVGNWALKLHLTNYPCIMYCTVDAYLQ